MAKNIGEHTKLDINKELDLMHRDKKNKLLIFSTGKHKKKGYYQIKLGIYYNPNGDI